MLLPFKISIDNETKKSDRLGRANYYIVYENFGGLAKLRVCERKG